MHSNRKGQSAERRTRKWVGGRKWPANSHGGAGGEQGKRRERRDRGADELSDECVSDDNSFLDDWMRAYKEETGFTDDQQPSTSRQGVQHPNIHMGRSGPPPASSSSHHAHLLQQPGTSAAIPSVAPAKSGGIGAKFHGKGPPIIDGPDRLNREGDSDVFDARTHARSGEEGGNHYSAAHTHTHTPTHPTTSLPFR